MTSGEPLSAQPLPAETERAVFWGYADLAVVAGMSLPSLFLGIVIVRAAMWTLHLRHVAEATQEVLEMLFSYTLLFTGVMTIFRVQYDRPFWLSLGWTKARVSVAGAVVCGVGTTIAVELIGRLMHTPPASGPLIELMKDHNALILLGIFATTAAPLFEELVFRGFLQPLLVRSLGAVAGIGIASALFGALHYSEYGNSWRSAVLVGLSGVGFGCVRHFSGSTKASTIAHASFNALPFLAMLVEGKNAV